MIEIKKINDRDKENNIVMKWQYISRSIIEKKLKLLLNIF